MIELYKNVSIKNEKDYFFTEGLRGIIQTEIRVVKKNIKVEGYHIDVIKYIIDYLLNCDVVIKDEETISYYSWLLKFKKSKNYYDIFEVSSNGDGFVEGIGYSCKVINDQIEECVKVCEKPIFPVFHQIIVISKGVYEGLGIDAIRYPSPDHMSGWWLLTDLYDDNIDSLMTVHYYDVAFHRKDILSYLALPYGYRFDTRENPVLVWYDEKIS